MGSSSSNLTGVICKVHAREIFDSRGNPTVEVEITAGGVMYRAQVRAHATKTALKQRPGLMLLLT